jgi:hypothetical protein
MNAIFFKKGTRIITKSYAAFFSRYSFCKTTQPFAAHKVLVCGFCWLLGHKGSSLCSLSGQPSADHFNHSISRERGGPTTGGMSDRIPLWRKNRERGPISLRFARLRKTINSAAQVPQVAVGPLAGRTKSSCCVSVCAEKLSAG